MSDTLDDAAEAPRQPTVFGKIAEAVSILRSSQEQTLFDDQKAKLDEAVVFLRDLDDGFFGYVDGLVRAAVERALEAAGGDGLKRGGDVAAELSERIGKLETVAHDPQPVVLAEDFDEYVGRVDERLKAVEERQAAFAKFDPDGDGKPGGAVPPGERQAPAGDTSATSSGGSSTGSGRTRKAAADKNPAAE